jgi:Nitroreductase family
MKTWDAIRARCNLCHRPASLRGTACTILGKLAALEFRGRNGPRAADRAGESLGPRPEAHHHSAAPIALVAKEPEDERHRDWLMYDFGQATANMMLAAAGLGIGSGHSAVINESGLSGSLDSPTATPPST